MCSSIVGAVAWPTRETIGAAAASNAAQQPQDTVLAAGAFAVGGYVSLTVAPPLRYLAVPLFAVVGLYTLYDLATVASHTR